LKAVHCKIGIGNKPGVGSKPFFGRGSGEGLREGVGNSFSQFFMRQFAGLRTHTSMMRGCGINSFATSVRKQIIAVLKYERKYRRTSDRYSGGKGRRTYKKENLNPISNSRSNLGCQ